MREYRKAAGEAAERRLKNIQSGEPHTKVDSSSWSPPDMLEADKQNGMRPVSKRQYKSGGKVLGAHTKKRADRKARKEGGRAMSVDGFLNRDDKMANDERAGVKKIGGMKRGGGAKHKETNREHKAMGGIPNVSNMPTVMPRRSIRPGAAIVPSNVLNRPRAGISPMAAKKGGRIHKQVAGGVSEDDITKLIRADEIMNAQKGRGLPTPPAPMPIPRPADKYTGPKPTGNPGPGQKRGGKVRAHHAKGGAAHSDEAADKALIRKMVKPSARTGKLSGGTLGAYIDKARENYLNDPDDPKNKQRMTDGVGLAASKISGTSGAKVPATYKKGGRAEHCWGGEAKSKKAEGGSTKWIQGAIKHPGSLHKALHVPAGEKIPAKKLEKAAHSKNPSLAKKANLAKTLKRMHHADGGEAGRGLYVRHGYPHEVPGVDGGRIARKHGGSAKGKGKTNINIMIHPHGAESAAPQMPLMPPRPMPPMPPAPPAGGMPPAPVPPMGAPMGGAPLPPMGAARPGMPPIGRKHGGNIPAGMKTTHIIDNAAGGGLGRLEKIKAYGLD